MNIIANPIPPRPPGAPRRRLRWLLLAAVAAALGLWALIVFAAKSFGI